MLIGEYRHSLDPKGRVNFPAKLREDLGDSFIICKGLDNCLYVYRMSEWDKLVEKTSALPSSKARTIQRFFFASAVCCEPDKQGRVLIPQTLRDYAGLTGEIAVIGVSTPRRNLGQRPLGRGERRPHQRIGCRNDGGARLLRERIHGIFTCFRPAA